MPTMSQEILLTPAEAAQRLGRSSAWVREAAASRRLTPAFETPRMRLYREQDVEELASVLAAGKRIKHRATAAGAALQIGSELAERAEKGEAHRLRRVRHFEVTERARRRAAEMQKRLGKLSRDRAVAASVVASIDAELADLAATLERLTEDLAIITPAWARHTPAEAEKK